MPYQLGALTHGVLRIGAGLLFLEHGLQKLFGLLGGMGGSGGTVPLISQFGLAGVLELVGGVLLIVGLATRPVAFVLLGEMIAAYLIAHMPRGGWPVQNQGELALLYAVIFLFLIGNGAGPFSVDETLALRARRPTPA
jgi:putative oxidoreductase